MQIIDNNLVEKIFSQKISKQEANKIFEGLSEVEKSQLISKLKQKVSNGDNMIDDVLSLKGTLMQVSEHQLNEHHRDFINKLTLDIEKFAPKSKENASKYQSYFVDQRRTGGLKKIIKSLQFHLTYDRGEGAYLYDIDGNKYVDIACDNGVNIFGHQPEFVKKAIVKRLNKGYPLVGYTEELFEVTRLLSELTGHERILLTQSGTEAVMWALRIARSVTQRKKIVIFDGSFHGLSDSVLASKDLFGNSIPMGLGMLQEFADQLIVLDYGNTDQLKTIENNASEIAGVLVEPVQSRHPFNQPVEFLKKLRELTLEKGILLIMDEMITGFRICSKGVQGYWMIKGDLATYGKIPAGGMPSGMVAGMAKYMDIVDGGAFSYTDGSMPSIKKTLIGGTHTRNPIKLASSLAVLTEFKKECCSVDTQPCNSDSCFLKHLNKKTMLMSEELNAFFIQKRVPVIIEYFGSLFRFAFTDNPNGIVKELLLILMRINGVETSPSGNCFLTKAHSDRDIDLIIRAIKESINTLLQNGFFYESETIQTELSDTTDKKNIIQNHSLNESQREKLRKILTSDLNNYQQKTKS